VAPVLSCDVVARFPHDRDAFTQGLIYRDGFLYESTGLNGESTLRKVDLATGRVLRRHTVARRYFAEGLTEFNGELFQLTWETGVGFVYDLNSFETRRRFAYKGEGWGLTHDGSRMIMSDGSPVLRFFDPATFRETGRLEVTDDGVPVRELNELEFLNGRIYANVWLTDRIVVIDPSTGRVEASLDLSSLMPDVPRYTNAVLNGIAYDAAGDRLFVTGKLWPTLFQIRVIDGRQ
jgi:glutaminyl-peptide cyclotransferase